MHKLTIAIPTYNRPEALLETVRSILATNRVEEVVLSIWDNASDAPADTLKEVLSGSPLFSTYQRNPVNIGMCANILRCIESCQTEWLWIVGDDDPITADAIDRILASIHQRRSCDIHCFSEMLSGELDGRTAELADFLRYPTALMGLGGISHSAFKAKRALAEIRHGYHYATTLFPHVVIFLALLSQGGNVYFERKTLLSEKTVSADQRWYWPSFDLGAGLLLDLPFLSAESRKLVRQQLKEYSAPRALFIHATAMRAARMDIGFILHTYFQSSARLRGVLRGTVNCWSLLLWPALAFPHATSIFLEKLYAVAGKKVRFNYYIESMRTKRIN